MALATDSHGELIEIMQDHDVSYWAINRTLHNLNWVSTWIIKYL